MKGKILHPYTKEIPGYEIERGSLKGGCFRNSVSSSSIIYLKILISYF